MSSDLQELDGIVDRGLEARPLDPLMVPEDDRSSDRKGELFDAGSFVPPKLGRAAEELANLRLGPGRSLWRYDHGVFLPDGEEWLAGYVRDALGDQFRENRLREVRAWCRANVDSRLPMQPSGEYVNVANGILYCREDPPRLESHSPKVPSIIQLPVAWDPNGECDAFVRYLSRVLPDDDLDACVNFLFEWFGYLLIPASVMQRALMVVGPGDTGKSTLLRILERFLGSENVTHHTLQSICDDRFTAADLYGRLANVCADLDAKAIRHSGTFKTMVAGDRITVERKYEHPFSFEPFTRLIFSANEAPGTADQSDAFYKRWLILPMTNKLAPKEQDPHLIRHLATPAELAGILRHAVRGLARLMERGRFELPASMAQAARDYRSKTDSVAGFVEAECVLVPEVRVQRGSLFDAYRSWCAKNGRQSLGAQRFKEHLESTYPTQLRAAKLHGSLVWFGIGLEGA